MSARNTNGLVAIFFTYSSMIDLRDTDEGDSRGSRETPLARGLQQIARNLVDSVVRRVLEVGEAVLIMGPRCANSLQSSRRVVEAGGVEGGSRLPLPVAPI
jgi:hypothetical protein